MKKEFLRFNPECVSCILGRFLNSAPKNASDIDNLTYQKGVLKIVGEAPNTASAPEIVAAITALKNKMFGYSDDYAELKSYFNKLMMNLTNDFEKHINKAEDKLFTALKFALLGNYIDFGALKNVDESRLLKIPKDAETLSLSRQEYINFKNDLCNAKTLVYLTDNCGEIVMDKLFISVIKELYPTLQIDIIVRGEPVLNDATVSDAKKIGLHNLAKLTPNGTGVAGTCLDKISVEAKSLIDNADLIISKGQGNFETLHGCGLNIYYLFLCKCALFADRFGVKSCTGMFINDKRIDTIGD